MPATKITYKQYIGMSGVDKYVVAYMKKRFKITDTKTVHQWTKTLKSSGAIDSTPIALLAQKNSQINEGEE